MDAKETTEAMARAAVAAAAQNAAKPGKKTSELWTSILLPALTAGGAIAVKLLGGAAVASMPWLAIPILAGAAALTSAAYSSSRGSAKAAALAAAGAALTAAAAPGKP
jgi:hypothetical protein